VHTRAVRLHAIDVMASYAAAIPLLIVLLSPFLPGRGGVNVPPASAAECADGSSLAARIGLPEMESEASGDKLLARLLTRAGLQLASTDALVTAGHLKPAKRKLRAAMHSLTRFRARVESLEHPPKIDPTTAGTLAAHATNAITLLGEVRSTLGTTLPVCSTSTTTTIATNQTTTSVTTTSTTTNTTGQAGDTTTTTFTVFTIFTLPPKLDYAAAAIYGEANLSSGFSPDPYSVGMTAGGNVDVSYLGGACSGFATTAPDLRINYGGGGSLLRIYFIGANGDPTMIVNDPYGNFYCVDDSFSTVNPTIDFDDPAGGSYDVWIGSSAASTMISGTLYLTEASSNHP
jgi:hypothetical protein